MLKKSRQVGGKVSEMEALSVGWRGGVCQSLSFSSGQWAERLVLPRRPEVGVARAQQSAVTKVGEGHHSMRSTQLATSLHKISTRSDITP